MSRKLSLVDISDHRAYANEREAFRADVIAVKKRRRIGVGPFVTFLFENRDTMRFQIQEMARVERIDSDEGIETELRAYNPLIPEPGELKATMFLELTTDELLREWIPKLANIERSVSLRIADDSVPLLLDSDHEKQLTREDMTSAVHYLGASLSTSQVAEFATGGAILEITHPEYRHSEALSAEMTTELLLDLRP
ncbi:MAG: DUF3501 family protein [Acidimicrobiales bacterium]